jgi:Skp family chaperone for outer membrane proteins
MKKVRFLVPLTICLVLVPAAALFAQQPQLKLAVVDSARAFQTSTEGKKALAQFQERDAKIKGDIQRLDDSLRALENRLNTGRLTMTQEALLATQADIEKKTTERKRYEEDATREFQQFQQNLVQRIRAEMVQIIQGLRKEKSYELVLDLQSSGVVDFDPAIDITEELVRRYDASKAGAPPVKK